MVWDARQMFARSFNGEADYHAHCDTFLRDRRGGLIIKQGRGTVDAYVNEGRWVADCPNCNGGIACFPDAAENVCLTCGHAYKVHWPKDRAAAEAALEQRPMLNQHWRPHEGESVKKLERENALMGVE